MYTEQPRSRPVTVSTLRQMKANGEKIAMLTAYDASFAAMMESAGVDTVLVGDSLGMVAQGHDATVPVSVDDIVYHTQMVRRGCRIPLLIADMPFMSYATVDMALRNAARLMQEGGAQMVKLEGGLNVAETVRLLAANGVPVCAHLGLQPQLVHKLGGYKVQGREEAAARRMLDDALALQDAGADMVVLECIPAELGARLTTELDIPTIGIGAGVDCDGQVLVCYDMLDITLGKRPKFSRNFMDGQSGGIAGALRAYVSAVKAREFPAPEHNVA
ncbi:3-methyl-2-oxobutanoate hydroxymethyltransferase [Plasticicumulans acidivorans]|uniref:3-methyl-2-oxobutanoate hydroxymethyltransferase n=1 Tax=Plasticicumulans acidivorans TaxID=886464 RepID=A0A317N271_9GAMM|nr:3-methyl-2-oxobutanoate hydroxymethyltransferase [Plasticicumulans acidivorans]PWV63393.1 ketopantoate hydroxymethyltransferase [Plasticicumulans acidivorans]